MLIPKAHPHYRLMPCSTKTKATSVKFAHLHQGKKYTFCHEITACSLVLCILSAFFSFFCGTIAQGWADCTDVILVAWRSYQVLLQTYPLEGGSCMGGEDCCRRHHLF